jgi:RNA polymerase sigma-70 factor (ECF subfamily)
MPEGESPGSDPADVVADRDLMDGILATLPPDQRAAVVLVDQEGLDYATTAELLGVPAGTVASRLNSARAKLRAVLTTATEDPCRT